MIFYAKLGIFRQKLKNSDMKCSLHRFVTRPRLVFEFLVTEGFVSMFDLSFAAF